MLGDYPGATSDLPGRGTVPSRARRCPPCRQDIRRLRTVHVARFRTDGGRHLDSPSDPLTVGALALVGRGKETTSMGGADTPVTRRGLLRGTAALVAAR